MYIYSTRDEIAFAAVRDGDMLYDLFNGVLLKLRCCLHESRSHSLAMVVVFLPSKITGINGRGHALLSAVLSPN